MIILFRCYRWINSFFIISKFLWSHVKLKRCNNYIPTFFICFVDVLIFAFMNFISLSSLVKWCNGIIPLFFIFSMMFWYFYSWNSFNVGILISKTVIIERPYWLNNYFSITFMLSILYLANVMIQLTTNSSKISRIHLFNVLVKAVKPHQKRSKREYTRYDWNGNRKS